ncbi:MAG: hypothetical protein AAGF12_37215 [Myxococcota bacterium]
MRVLLAVALVGVVSGCSDDFRPGFRVVDTRVLGVRAEVVGDEARSRPRPGETLRFEVFAAGPGGPASVSWAMTACATAGDATGGVGRCAGDVLALDSSVTPSPGPPELTVVVPTGGLAGVREIVLLGVLCGEGEPDLAALADPSALPENLCTNPATPGEPFVATATIDFGDDANRTPRWADQQILLDGSVWPLPGTEGCTGQPARPRAQGDAIIGFTGFPDEDREFFTVLVDDPPRPEQDREALQISHFTTAGEMERQFSVIEDVSLEPNFEWTPPDEATIDPAGTLVRFYFVLRDLRGGVDWAERQLCITP